VFVDANVILDFSEPKDDGIFQKFQDFLCLQENSEFYTTNYILIFEVNDSAYLEEILGNSLKEYQVSLNELYTREPPPGIDLGEWSIFLAVESLERNGVNCCVLCNDKSARMFFESRGFLPCEHITPPPNGVGGTWGILEHLKLRGIISHQEKEKILDKMRSSGRRL